jgi:CRISPR/Cas system-associated exonuclease Cas4 (RecB family)
MSKRDKIHDSVKRALVNDGWTITADPYEIEYKESKLKADLAANKVFAAQRKHNKIVVEVKSFLSPSPIHELQAAVGQYQMYQMRLETVAPDRDLYLAISETIWEEFFTLEIT